MIDLKTTLTPEEQHKKDLERLEKMRPLDYVQTYGRYEKLGTVSNEDIAKATGLTMEEVQELAAQISVVNA